MNSFKGIEIEGYCNIKSLYYRLDRPGINVLRGVNGIGKTQIFSSLSWCLFGKTLKESNTVEPWDDKKSKNYRGTIVHVYYNEYTITRCRNFKGDLFGYPGKNRVVVCKDGKPLDNLRDTPDVQAFINNLLGFTWVVFKNSIVFGQKLTRLIGESGPAKKKIFEEAFSIMFIEEAKERAKKKLKTLSDEQRDELNKKIKLDSLIESTNSQLLRLQSDYESWEKICNKNILEVKRQIKEAKSDIDRTKARLKEHKLLGSSEEALEKLHLQKSPREIEVSISSAEYYIKSNQKLLDNLETEYSKFDSGVCPTCGAKGKIDKKHREEKKLAIKDLIRSIYKLKEELRYLNEELVNVDKTYLAMRKEYDARKRAEDVLKVLESTYSSQKRILEQYRKKHEELKNKTSNPNPFIKSIKENQLIITKNTPLLEEINKSLKKINKRVESLNWVISDPLSNKGIKAYIFEHNLKKINTEAKKYSKILGFGVLFSINLDSKTKEFNAYILQGEHTRDYDDLSGGQQQLVDVCIAFAMHDVIRVNHDTNILLMDEIFESLDAANIEKVADLIKMKSQGTCVHLVTHRNDFTIQNATLLKLLPKNSGLVVTTA